MLRHCVLIFKATAAMPCLRFENCNFQELGCTKPVSQLTRRGMTLKTDAFKMLSYSKTYNSNHTVLNSYVLITEFQFRTYISSARSFSSSISLQWTPAAVASWEVLSK